MEGTRVPVISMPEKKSSHTWGLSLFSCPCIRAGESCFGHKMKTLTILLSFALGAAAIAQTAPVKIEIPALPKPEVPTIKAVTLSSSKKSLPATAKGVSSNAAIRTIRVAVEYRYSQKPTIPVEIQCFFLEKTEPGRNRYVFNMLTDQASERQGKLEFNATGSVGQSTGLIYSQGQNMPPALVKGKGPTYTSKIEGWIVRVVSNGVVLKTESNQPALAAEAMAKPGKLNDIVIRWKTR